MSELIVAVTLLVVAVVAVTAIIVVSRNQTVIARLEKQIASKKITLPLRLQAYERCLIFLERISPDSLIVRVNKPDYTAKQLQYHLLSNIRSEFEHNLAQQLYVSSETWVYLVNAKNNIIGLVNSCSMKLSPDSNGTELAKLILESFADLDSSPAQFAKQKIKTEVVELY